VNSYLLAITLKTGQVAWKKERPGYRRGFATPLLLKTPEREEIVAAGTLKAAAYSAADGAELWSMKGLPNEMCATPVEGDGLVYVGGWTSGVGDVKMTDFEAQLKKLDRNNDGMISHEEADGVARYHFPYIDANKDEQITREEWDSLAAIFNESKSAIYGVKPGGHGDVTQTHVVWSQTKGLPYVPSPLFYRGRIYLVKNGGFLTCLDAGNGASLFAEAKLGAGGDYYASPVAANGKIFLTSRKGIVTVVKAGDKLEILAQNEMGESILATPAIVGGSIYIRTQTDILAIGAQPGM
jgi:outer membrane protein assembly factor BamB